MKKLLFLLLMITGVANAQPYLVITNYTGYTVTPSGSTAIITFDNVQVNNIDTANFNDVLRLDLGIEDPPGTVTYADSNNVGFQTIPGGDSITFPTVSYTVDTAVLKDGNNTVVISPYAPMVYIQSDSSVTVIYVSLSDTWGIEDGFTSINISQGPNPASTYVVLQDPENILQSIRVNSMDGKRMNVPVHAKTIDVSRLPEGIYIVEILTSKGTLKRKLVVKR